MINNFMALIPFIVLFIFIIVIEVVLYRYRKELSESFATKYSKEMFAFLLALGTTNAILDFLKFNTLYGKLPEEFIGYIHHFFYILVLLLFLFVYRFLLSDITNRILEAIEKKYSESGSRYAEYFSVLFNLETHNDEFKILDTLLRDYKKLSQKHQYLISLDAYLELTKNFFKEGYNAVGVNYLLPPFWIAPNFQNSSINDYIKFFENNKKELSLERINVFNDASTANNMVQFAMNEIEKSLDGKFGTYLWILDLVQALDIMESDFDTGPKFTSAEIQSNIVIEGISWTVGVKHFSNSNSYSVIQGKDTEIDAKVKWFKANLISVTNKKVKQKFKELHKGNAYYVPSELFNQKIKTKYNWAEVVIFENKKFNRKIGIGVINNIDNAVLMEVIVDNNQIEIIHKIFSEAGFKNKYD